MGASPHVLELPRVTRLEAKADLTLWRSVAPDRLVYSRERRPVFVRPHDAAAVETLRRAGVRARLGEWSPVRLDSVALLEILGAVGKTEVRAAPALRPMLDISLPEIRAPEVHRGEGLERGRDGTGVLVGIIDMGLDLTHPAFSRADGSSRVVAIWDQDAVAGSPPSRFGYGRFCATLDIVADGCGVTDPSGHGSHVTGIAAGADGVAPGADIALVRSATFTHLADAVLFLVELADERDQPLVINISVGGHYGAHDGQTPLESYIERILGPGRLAVAAAGNDGAGRFHLGADLQPEPQRVSIDQVPWGTPTEIIVELWTTPGTEIELTLELWIDGNLETVAPLSAHGAEYLDGDIDVDGRVIAQVAFGAEVVPDNGLARRTVLIDPTGADSPPAGTTLALAMTGRGRLNGWIRQSDYRYGMARFGRALGSGWLSGDGVSSITVPATSPSMIAVGSYSVRHRWLSEVAGEQGVPPVPFGSLSAFSSRGPTLAPELTGSKPDLIAPGSIIASARAMDVPAGANTLDASRMLMQGTSMAAPHVTGALALMLEADPGLTPATARALLQQTARRNGLAGEEEGAGRLDAFAAVALVESRAPGCAALPLPLPLPLPWITALGLALVWRRRGRRP